MLLVSHFVLGIVFGLVADGVFLAMKILGAAAAKEYSFERLVEIGRAVNEQLVSIGSALDHCHVPGRQNHDEIGEDVCVVGAGIHNEPVSDVQLRGQICTDIPKAVEKVSPIPSVEDLVKRLLNLVCDQRQCHCTEVAFPTAARGEQNPDKRGRARTDGHAPRLTHLANVL